MKKRYYFCFLLVLFSISSDSLSQVSKPLYLGTKAELRQKLTAAISNISRINPILDLKVADGSTVTGAINFMQSENGTDYFIGAIQGIPGSSFHLKIGADTLVGSVIYRESNIAYSYFADNGNAYVEEVDINDLLCVNLEDAPAADKTKARGAAISPALFNLESQPGAAGCVLLDFDGHYVSGTYWNSGNPIDAAPSGMTDAAVAEHWEIVAEDFKPFNVNITTNEAVFNAYPRNRRMRCIVTPTTTAAPGAGGVAYIGSFGWDDDTPCWTFITSGKAGGEASSHEVGHTFSLRHDGRTSPSEGYFTGHGNWAPIMGVGYYKGITQWSRGEYAFASNTEDDLAKITGTSFGVGYKADDHGNSVSDATILDINSAGNVSSAQNQGIIERNTDFDYFSFSTAGGNILLNINTVSRHGDLDLVVRLYNQSGTQIGTFDPSGLDAAVTANLGAGSYFISITGTGAGDPATNGYSAYASLGSYSIAGTIPPATTVQSIAVFYRDCSYGGDSVGLAAGDYSLSELNAQGILDNDISSISVNSGYEVVLYDGDNFSGTSYTVSADDACLVAAAWNDKTTSLRIRTSSGVATLSGIYHIQNRSSSKYLDVSGVSQNNGANIQLWRFTGAGNQQFEFLHLGNGTYKITAVHSGKALAISAASTADGGNLHQYGYNETENQQFVAQAATDGYYKLVAKHSGKILETDRGLTANGTNIHQWADNGQTHGQWKLIPIVTTPPPFSTKIEAETYSTMAGVRTQTTSDTGGGLNVGWIDTNDWMNYTNINIPSTGSYQISYRVASPNGGQLALSLNNGATSLGTATIPATGEWQAWTTITQTVNLTAGNQSFRITSNTKGWNINWFSIANTGGALSDAIVAEEIAPEAAFGFYPNPVRNEIKLISSQYLSGGQVSIFNETGKEVYKGQLQEDTIDVSSLKEGLYLFMLIKDGKKISRRFIKQ